MKESEYWSWTICMYTSPQISSTLVQSSSTNKRISFFSRKLLYPQNTTDKATAKEVN